MNIQEIDSTQLDENGDAFAERGNNFIFEQILDTNLFDKESFQKIQQWGLESSFNIFKFRFNLGYDDLNIKNFLVDLFNSNDCKKAMSSYVPTLGEHVTDVTYERLRSTVVNMNLFDKLLDEGLLYDDGAIKKCMGYDEQDIEVNNRIRSAILVEDSEEFLIFDHTEKNELLFRLLQLFMLGGRLNQYEDNFNEYKNILKPLYKNLVNVKKDASTNHVYVDSVFYSVSKVGGNNLFDDDHIQNVCYVLINKGTRSAWVIYNKWNKYAF